MNGPAESNEEPMESRRRSEAPVGDAFPFGRGGGATTGAELRVSLADGVSIELSAASVEARGAVVALVDHAADLLGAHLGAPGAAPLPPPSPAPTSADREDAEKFALRGACAPLRLRRAALRGVGDRHLRRRRHGARAQRRQSEGVSGGGGGGEVCATFTNEINLMDFVRDVHEVYPRASSRPTLGFATRGRPEVRGASSGSFHSFLSYSLRLHRPFGFNRRRVQARHRLSAAPSTSPAPPRHHRRHRRRRPRRAPVGGRGAIAVQHVPGRACVCSPGACGRLVARPVAGLVAQTLTSLGDAGYVCFWMGNGGNGGVLAQASGECWRGASCSPTATGGPTSFARIAPTCSPSSAAIPRDA